MMKIEGLSFLSLFNDQKCSRFAYKTFLTFADPRLFHCSVIFLYRNTFDNIPPTIFT